MKTYLSVLALAAGSLFAQASWAAGSPNLNQTSWQLTSLTGWKGSNPSQIQPRASLSFNNGTVNGTDSCNNFRASYSHPRVPKIKQSLSIRMDQAMSTLMACPPEQNQLSQALARALKQTYQYQITNQSLHLLDQRGMVLASFEHPATNVPGTSWQLISYNTGKAMMSSLNTEKMTASFHPDGSVSGFAGCNKYQASYRIDEARGTLQLGPVASTKMLCPNQELMQEEDGFLKAWQRVRLYGRQGDGLSLFDAKGNRLMDFRFTGDLKLSKPAVKPQVR